MHLSNDDKYVHLDNNACLSMIVLTPPVRDFVDDRYVDDTEDFQAVCFWVGALVLPPMYDPPPPPTPPLLLALLDCDVFRIRLVPVGVVVDAMVVLLVMTDVVPSNSR